MDEHDVYQDLIGQEVPVPMPARGVLVFDGLLFHTAGRNESPHTRMSITLGYRSVDELSKTNDPESEVIVRGERIYKGNDVNVY